MILDLNSVTLVLDDIRWFSVFEEEGKYCFKIKYNDDNILMLWTKTYDDAVEIKSLMTKCIADKVNYLFSNIDTA